VLNERTFNKQNDDFNAAITVIDKALALLEKVQNQGTQ
jgi:hypothetical protein